MYIMALTVKATKTAASTTKSNSIIPALEAYYKDIDAFVIKKQAIKDLEGELVGHTDALNVYCVEMLADRYSRGELENFKIASPTHVVSYICQNFNQGGLHQDVFNEVATKYGKEAADSIMEIDYKTFVLNGEAMEKHYDRINEVLSALEAELGMDVVLPGKYKLKPNFAANCRVFAKTRDAIKTLIDKCGLKKYPQASR
jgi:hypothetical protein